MKYASNRKLGKHGLTLMRDTGTLFWNLASVVAVLAFAGSLVFGKQQVQIPQDEIIEKVTCIANPEQSYALFLPPGYTPEKKWPILYAFDPLARGAVPLKLFRDAAKEFGFILVGSNNSRNGIDLNAIVETLWSDSHQRFAIDERRVYTRLAFRAVPAWPAQLP